MIVLGIEEEVYGDRGLKRKTMKDKFKAIHKGAQVSRHSMSWVGQSSLLLSFNIQSSKFL